MYESYFVLDIETSPIDLDEYLALEDEEEKSKKLNPIDSRIIAIGVRHDGEDRLFTGNEKEILVNFWREWKQIREKNPSTLVIGFNVVNFDIPFVVARSFINNVEIIPFSLKSILDLKEKINAYRYGKTRGKLEEYGKLLGINTLDVTGKNIPELFKNNEFEIIENYLKKDLEITEKLFERAKSTGVIHISRY